MSQARGAGAHAHVLTPEELQEEREARGLGDYGPARIRSKAALPDAPKRCLRCGKGLRNRARHCRKCRVLVKQEEAEALATTPEPTLP